MCAGSWRKKQLPMQLPQYWEGVRAAIVHVRSSRRSMMGLDVHLLRVVVFCGVPCGLEGVTLLLAAARSLAKALASHSIYSTDTICSAAFLETMHHP